jgi:hypothetical protein
MRIMIRLAKLQAMACVRVDMQLDRHTKGLHISELQ